MSPEQFEHLLAMVAKFISKNDTHLRKCIFVAERLALTLLFFATGDGQQSPSFSYVLFEIKLFYNFTPCISVDVAFLVRHFAFVVKTRIIPYLFH